MKVSSWLRGMALALASSGLVSVSSADSISLNFSENSSNQSFAGGQLIGPLMTDSATWNNTNGQPNLDAGALAGLIDDSGANTGASVAWSSSNVWYNFDGTSDDEHRMAVGYLDDGDGGAGTSGDGIGVSVTFSSVPYSRYRVYGLLGSDQDGGTNYNTLDFTVNGVEVFGAATAAPAYNTITESMAQTGSFWSLADGTTRGNYWQIDSTGSTLAITAPPRDGANRASLSAVIIEEIVPEPGSLALAACGSLIAAASFRRRN
ncbi:MAG TPA: hypothetical protein VF175_19830 [Lacipirellula sp.]